MEKRKMMIIGAIVAIVLVVLAGVGYYVYTKKKAATDQGAQATTQKKKKIETYNTIPVGDRPYITIRPSESGKNILLDIVELKKPAEDVDYELEYQAGELLQGAFGQLTLGSLPAEKDILLGSCSAGGACTYHTDVQGGTIVTRFSGTNEYALKNDWRYIENKNKDTSTGSKDAKFQITSPELAKQKLIIITNSPGYPGTVPGTPISDVYTLAATAPLTGKVTVTIRAAEDVSAAKLAVWDGKAWTTVTGKADDKSLTVDTEFAQAYVVVK